MNEKQIHLLEIGAVLVGGLGIALLLKHSTAPTATATTGDVTLTQSGTIPAQNPNPATDYLTFNWPPEMVKQALPGVPTNGVVALTPNGGNGCGCNACNAGNSAMDLAPSLNGMIDDLSKQYNGLTQNYISQVEAATPTWFSSYFNNQAGTLASQQSAGAFLSLE